MFADVSPVHDMGMPDMSVVQPRALSVCVDTGLGLTQDKMGELSFMISRLNSKRKEKRGSCFGNKISSFAFC